MAAPVEPSPPWDAHLPPPWQEPAGWVADELAPFPDGDDPGWHGLGDDLALDPADDLAQLLTDEADEADEADGGAAEGSGSWAVPGVAPGGGDEGGGGLSRAVAAALAETAAAWQALRRAEARCYRALTALEDCDAVGQTGYRATSRLLTDHVRIDPAEGRRLARHARALTSTVSPTGAPVPAPLPATAVQVSAGVIGPGHVEIIRATMRRLAAVADLAPEVLATTEEQLAQLATTRSPAALADAAAAIVALLDSEGAAPEDQPAPENELHYLRRRNGALVGRFTYRDPAAAEALHTALAVATPPPDPTPDPVEGEPRGESYGVQAARTLPERRAHALLDLAGEALTRGLTTDHPTADHTTTDHPAADTAAEDPATPGLFDDHDGAADEGPADEGADQVNDDADLDADADAGDEVVASGAAPRWSRADLEGGERVALTVTLNYDTLRHTLTEHPATGPTPGLHPALALLGEHTHIRPETARRLACDAEIIPALLAARGDILDIGRKTRTIPRALRRAVTLRDRHCAHPGCRRRARRCQVHHITHWADHGETCLTNCVLLCSYHHTLIHHSDWHVHMIDGLPWFTPPAWLDPQRRPRHNRPWHDQQTT